MRLSTRQILILSVVVWVTTLGMAFSAGVLAYRHRYEIRGLVGQAIGSVRILQTNLYNLSMHTVSIPKSGRDGGIDALGDGLLFVSGNGAIWYVTADRALTRLGFDAPINVEEFAGDEFNRTTDRLDQFAVKDILVQSNDAGIRLLAAHHYWYTANDCYVLRVSELEATQDEILNRSYELQARWQTVFETEPCLPLESWNGGMTHVPSMDAGGRLAALSEHQLLLTVGHFAAPDIQSRDNSYGKVVLIDLHTGDSRIFTTGHRNPQGLIIAADGTIWLTEHGPRGGDELNRIIEGRNYGFPIVTYGTDYGALTWRTNPRQGRHDGFEGPAYAWLPSVGISQLVEIDGKLFSHWEHDIIVSSLVGRSLFRLRVDDGHVVFAEPIPVGLRIRDIGTLKDGTLALKTDDDLLLFIRPLESDRGDSLSPVQRGALISSACSGCHALGPGDAAGLAPSLWGIVGRRVAAVDSFDYSTGLQSLGGVWTQSRLREYIRNPQAFAPGTQMMTTASYPEASLDDLIAFLETLE